MSRLSGARREPRGATRLSAVVVRVASAVLLSASASACTVAPSSHDADAAVMPLDAAGSPPDGPTPRPDATPGTADATGPAPDANPESPDASACAPLVPVDDSPLPQQSVDARTETTTVNGYTDDYVYNESETFKLGMRRDWGGSIIFFGNHTGTPGENGTNTVDGADTGREVQVALYDRPERMWQGCAHNASCGTNANQCVHDQVHTGWNPTQGGNRCNIGADVTEFELSDGQVAHRLMMFQWNPNWDRPDCVAACNSPSTDSRGSEIELTQRARFVRPNVVELVYTIRNTSDLSHGATVHEVPTLYSTFGRNGTPDLYRLFDSTGTEVTTGWNADPVHDFEWQNFSSTGGWASLQDATAGYGVAIYYESGMANFQAWRKLNYPTKFNNVRGMYNFPIPAFATIRARSYLILGGIDAVKAETAWLAQNLPPFGFLDTPGSDSTVSGTIEVRGWALDNRTVTGVQAVVDGGTPTPLAYGSARADVCTAWPGYAACATGNIGFQGTIDTGNWAPANCGHVLEIRATDSDGNQRIIARKRLYTP